MKWRIFSASIFSSLLLMAVAPNAQAFNCPSSGPIVATEAMCKFFVHYGSETATPDARIISRLKLQAGDRTRSIALIIGISSYPNFSSDAQLPPAANDVTHLTKFLRDDQKFDEIIVLQNADATADNISYFLDDYLLARAAQFNNKARILIAYSGHGVPQRAGLPPAIVLGNATSVSDVTNSYALSRIRTSVENLAGASYHVLALINACYGGTVFSYAFGGGQPSDSYSPGTYALTAGADNQLVYSLRGPGDGSIFFDEIIKGVTFGDADPNYPQIVIGTNAETGGVVRLGALSNYLETQIEILNNRNPPSVGQPYSPPWIGPLMPSPQKALGGFFFLSRVVQEAHGFAPSPPVVSTVAFGAAVSSVPGHPNVKIFNAPSDYPIRGIDVSRFTPVVDWNAVKSDVNFAYLKATQAGTDIDTTFKGYWASASAAGIDRGAYHVMGFCDPVERQFDLIKSVVPKDNGALPFAIDPELYLFGPASELACGKALGMPEIQKRILHMAQLLHEYYGKVPIIYAPRQAFSDFQDDQFSQYMIWLASYRLGAKAPDVRLPGRNPWTLWQFSPTARFPGISSGVNESVFFGTPAQFQQFKEGETNVALAAVTK